MTQEELKNIILTHVNLGPGGRLEVERFFSECEGITVDNCMEKLWAWRNSQSGKTAFSEIEQEIADRKSVLMQKGLTAIQRGDYRVFENTHRLGTYVVKSNETGFFGLITDAKEEILPCIFDSISVKLGGWLELVFQEKKFNGSFGIDRILPDNDYGFWYGSKGGYYINDPQVKEGTPFWRCLQQLVDLLNVNHRSADAQDN